MRKRNVLSSPRLAELKNRRRRAIFSKILISGAGILAVFFLLSYLSRLDNLNIREVRVTGNEIVETEAIREEIESRIAGELLWLFPKTNVLYYPKNAIKSGLRDKFKRLKDVNFSIQDREVLEVTVSERVPKYTWCGSTPTSEECYFLDEEGYIFDGAPYFSGEVYFKFYGQPDGDEPLGTYFLKQNFRQLVWFKDFMIELGLKPAALYATGEGDMEIFLSRGGAPAAEPKILLKADADFQNAAENLKTALNTEPLKSEFKNKYSSLQYIDLRFGDNKVYYKF